jgi:DsbC/DsbD-like thiol-disulfide interchange protein/cytochrome c biogenesis protein CcdA
MRWVLLLLLLLPGICMPRPAAAATSNVFTSSRASVSLISAANTAEDGQIQLALKFHLAPGWHIYWSNPGDAGLSPQIALDAPAGAGPFIYPPPELFIQGGVAAYVLSGDVLLPFTATGVGNNVRAKAFWLVCKDVCVPEHANFLLALTGGISAEASLFTNKQVVPSPFATTIAPDGQMTIAGLSRTQVRMARFFPDASGAIINNAPQKLSFSSAGLTLHLSPGQNFNAGKSLSGVLELSDPSGAMQPLRLDATPGAAPGVTPLALWLGFAFLGGLILNLMPCVFPVLAMKAFAITRFSGAGKAHIRREALGYTAGVLVAMLAIGLILISLRAVGENLGWGFQFQSPIFVALVAWLILMLGLNLAGIFEISLPSKFLHLHYHGSFFTGLLAVIVATPCTAPFMGGAIAAALTAPLPAALGIFLALGIGLAAPFLLLAIFPAMAGKLPRPGAWMLHLQRALSLPMFATFIWLAWVMLHEAGATATLLLCLGAAAIGTAFSIKKLRPAAALALLTLPFLHTTQAAASLSLPNAEPYTPARLASLRASNVPVFIDLTAAWCVTCLVNEHSTLTTDAVQSAFAARHIKTLVGDWTNRDPAITRLLQLSNRDGVPLYLYFPAGAAPITLPQILTPQIVLNAIK